MSSLWQVFEEADVEARKGHAKRIEAVAALLEIYPAVSLAGVISTRSQASRDGLLSHDQVTQLRTLVKPGEDGVWVETLGCPFSAEEFQIAKLERLARCEVARKLERKDGGCFLKMEATPDERYVDGRFRLLPEHAAALESELDARVPDHVRLDGLAAAQANALMQLVADAATNPVGNGLAAGMKTTVVVRSDTAVLAGSSDTPGELPNGNLVPAGVVRDLAGAGRLLVLDLDGVDLNTEQIPAPVRTPTPSFGGVDAAHPRSSRVW